jgi:hypothetical protein
LKLENHLKNLYFQILSKSLEDLATLSLQAKQFIEAKSRLQYSRLSVKAEGLLVEAGALHAPGKPNN